MNLRDFLIYSTILVLCSCAKTNQIDPYQKKTSPPPFQIKELNLWWQSFNDPLMDKLVQDLLTQNLDIKIAEARIAEARGIVRAAQSGLFPDISVAANSSRGNKQIGIDKPLSISQGGFDTSWEIDIFGQTQALIDSTERKVESRTAAKEDVTNSVIAELVQSIIEWRQANQLVKETTNLLNIQDEQISLIATQAKAGLIDGTFLTRAQAENSQTATRLPIAKSAVDTAEYKIERLLGKEPESLRDIIKRNKGELTIPVDNKALDISLDIIRQRPDIRASRADLLAAKADLTKAESNLWPRISIRSFFGVQDISNNVPLTNNPIWSLASGVTAPLLNFGRLQGEIDTSDARANAAAISYQNSILNALQETKVALCDYLNGVNAVNEQQQSINHRKETVNLALDRFKRGLTDMTDVTNAKIDLSQATLFYLDKKTKAAIAYVKLQKALGTSVKKKNHEGLPFTSK